jgi:hypothetical protein
MNKKCLLATFLAVAPFAAQAVEVSYTFDSISAIKQRGNNTSITGILINDSVPTTVSLPTGSTAVPNERCDRLYVLMLDQPGKYTLTVTKDIPTPTGGPPMPESLLGCTLEAKP